MITYRVLQRVNPRNLEEARKYYALTSSNGDFNLREMGKRISRESTVSMGDTMAVLEGLLSTIPDLLLEGKIVRLGELGTFRVTISSEGVENPDDFHVSKIKGLHLKFRPGKEFRDQLKLAEYTRVPPE